MNSRFFRRVGGFSLVELSVVLMIISITMASALDLSINYNESENIKTTEKKINRIEKAFENYILANKSLPCPAKPNERVDEANFGRGDEPVDGACPYSINGGGVALGIPPVRDLGLADEDILDGWGRRIEYAVDIIFTNNLFTHPACHSDKKCFFYAKNGLLVIQKTNGTLVSPKAVYVLISHGNNGLGGYNSYGAEGSGKGRMPDPPDSHTSEKENAEPPAAGSSPPDNVFVQGDRTAIFDDIIAYKTKWRISSDAKGLGIDKWSVCQAARNDPGKSRTACNGTAPPPAPAACEVMAEAIWMFCLDDYGS